MRAFSAARLFLLAFLAALLAACAHPFSFSDPTAELKLQAEQGNPRAQLFLGHLLDEGAGLPRDDKAAAGWYRKSAGQGNPQACLGLARLLLGGWGGSRNDAEAVRLLFLAGEAGESRAQVLLGGLYLAGKAKDEFAAQVNRYRRGAEQGDKKAEYQLGWLFREGAGLPRSISQAHKWLTRSAAKGYAPAARLLGDLAYAGEGVPKDVAAALRWYGKGAAGGDEVAAGRLEELNELGFASPKHASVPPSGKLTGIEQTYFRLQMDLAEKATPEMTTTALLAARRVAALSPLDKQARRMVTRLGKEAAMQLNPLVLQAGQDLAVRKRDAFRQTMDKILIAEFDEQQLRDLVALSWQRADETTRLAGERVIAEQARKRDETVETPDSLFRKGQAFLDGGQLEAAARIFEKLARTPGYSGIAVSYVYLGITWLARISPANVTEAKKLRLKGMSSFQNALRFDREVTLPAGYGKYLDVFTEAKRRLK